MSGMRKPICTKCQRFYRPAQNGVYVLEQMPKHSGAAPGRENAASWTPYKVWIADKWKCEGCGNEIVVGSGPQPLSEHSMTDFAIWRGRTTVTVNDC